MYIKSSYQSIVAFGIVQLGVVVLCPENYAFVNILHILYTIFLLKM